MTTTEERIAQIRERLATAPGPWYRTIPEDDWAIQNAPDDLRFLLDCLGEAGRDAARYESAIRWALGEEGDFAEVPEGLSYAIGMGVAAIRKAGSESKPKDRPLFWWRSALREKAFGPSLPPSQDPREVTNQ